jgi:hypothetical protein
VLSRAIYRKQRGRGPLTALAVLSLVTSLLVVSGTVLAVHDEDFQLDGDVIASTTTNAGGSTQTVDWDSIFDANGDAVASLPTGFSDPGFEADFNVNGNGTFNTSDNTTYATGSKDTLPISGWQCNQDNNVNSKIDVMNAYSVSGTNTDGDEIVYFALERNVNTGTADVGFWFLQSAVSCVSTGSAVTFSGAHTDGDVLVVSEFTNGGTVSVINVYRWDGGANGSLNTTPVGAGVDCRSATTLPGDSACAAANTTANGTNGTITTPWLTANFKDKVGHSLRTSEFFEGGINLTDLNLGGRCFNTFIGDTRSSTSLTATLFDFAAGETGSCASGVSTAQDWVPNDSATVSVTGTSTWAGSVAFTLYDNLTCDGSVLYTESVNVSDSNTTVSTGNTAAYTATGDFSWKAVFTPDATSLANGVTASEHCENSSLTVDNNP